MTIELYPHQGKAIKKLKNGSILWGRVGSGKSLAAIAYYFTNVCGGTIPIGGHGKFSEMKNPKDLYIITTAKKRDAKEWEKDLSSFMIGRDPSESFSGVKVTVDSWNNISKYKDVNNAFFLFDEQRLVGSGTWVKAFLSIAKSNQWLLLSATPGDTWTDYIPVFVANGFYRNRSEFLRRHAIFSRFSKFPKIERFIDTGRLEKLRNQILVEMPYKTHTTRHTEMVKVEYDKEKYDRAVNDRWHIYEERPLRDVGELFQVIRKLVNTDVSRLGATLKLLEKHPRLIIFYNFDCELEILRTLGNVLPIPVKEWNGHKHEPIPEGDSWVYLVQYSAGAEGWNCVSTNAILFYSANYSYKLTEQAKGRIDRLNTPYKDLYYYFLRSPATIDTAIHKALNTKKDFNERYFVEMKQGKWAVNIVD